MAKKRSMVPTIRARHCTDAAEALRFGQNHLLELIARGGPLHEVLNHLMVLMESQSEGLFCSLLLLDADGIHIRTGAGPSMPPDYMAALNGLTIGPKNGSCGTAMYRKQPVVVADLANDPLWSEYKELVLPFGFLACWSKPILSNHQVLGTFAMYYKEVRSPRQSELDLMEVATHIAGIAIERARREHELERYRFQLEELVTERTAELNVTQEALARRDKQAALGALVAGVSHELNTPIGVSLAAASTLVDHTQNFAENYAAGLTRSSLEKFIADAATAGELLVRNLQRAASLVSRFKQISTEQSGAQRSRFLVSECLHVLDTLCNRSGFTIHKNIRTNAEVDSYPGPLADALLNLVNNAIAHGYAGRSSGDIYIAVQPTSPGWIELEVTDRGAGVSPAYLSRLFDPFFTTRLGTGSSGLGLYITHNIVTEVLGGRIHVNSTMGRGSSFILALPLIAPVLQHP